MSVIQQKTNSALIKLQSQKLGLFLNIFKSPLFHWCPSNLAEAVSIRLSGIVVHNQVYQSEDEKGSIISNSLLIKHVCFSQTKKNCLFHKCSVDSVNIFSPLLVRLQLSPNSVAASFIGNISKLTQHKSNLTHWTDRSKYLVSPSGKESVSGGQNLPEANPVGDWTIFPPITFMQTDVKVLQNVSHFVKLSSDMLNVE